MKLTLPTLLFSLLTATSVMSQKVDKAKSLLEAKKLTEAKIQIDKVLENPKKADDADAYYTKAKIYSALAEDSALRPNYPDARDQAFDALKQYITLDNKDGGKQFTLQLEQYRTAFDIYYGYYKTGAAFYNSNNFSDAFANFKMCLEVGDYAREKNWKGAPSPLYTSVIDTNVVMFTGIAAERCNKKDSAAFYYAQIADRKITSQGMEDLYKWLVDYYHQKKDAANTQKYLALGKELYPADSYWTSVELEIASNSGNKDAAYKKYEEMIAKEPSNSIYPYNYGVELYREIYSLPLEKRPANAKEMLAKAEGLIRKSLELNPDYVQANLVLGQILYNQAVELSEQQRLIKPGVPASKLTPEDIKQKEELKAEMFKKFDEAIPFLDKVGTTLDGKSGQLSGDDKRTLKAAYDLLTTIYNNKQDKQKTEEYQNKVNSVDSRHQ